MTYLGYLGIGADSATEMSNRLIPRIRVNVHHFPVTFILKREQNNIYINIFYSEKIPCMVVSFLIAINYDF